MHRHLDAVTLPDGTVVWAASFADDYARDDPPDHGIYFDQRWSPPWSHELVEWPDFGLPTDIEGLVRTLEGVLDRARRGERVEMGCLGGHGRTGTALACLVALVAGAGAGAGDAGDAGDRVDPVDWVRRTYCSHAVETDAQAALARSLRGDPGSCEECGFGWDVDRATAITLLAQHGGELARVVSAAGGDTGGDGDGGVVRRRPSPGVWSPLEYAAHCADALDWYRERIVRTLSIDRPQFEPFDWDAACEERQYNQRAVPATVASLRRAVDEIVGVLESVDPLDWTRIGIGSDGGERTVLALARRAAHEAVHHLHDVRRIEVGQVDANPTIGLLSERSPVEPKNGASP